MEYKKKILSLAKEHQKAGDLEKVDRYYMPKDDVVRTASFLYEFCCAKILKIREVMWCDARVMALLDSPTPILTPRTVQWLFNKNNRLNM